MRVTVRVKPGSRKGPLVVSDDEQNLTVYVPERAIDGAANEAVIRLLAAHFGCAKSRIEIESGYAARLKRIRVDV